MYFKKFKWTDSPNLLHSVQSTWKMIGFVWTTCVGSGTGSREHKGINSTLI